MARATNPLRPRKGKYAFICHLKKKMNASPPSNVQQTLSTLKQTCSYKLQKITVILLPPPHSGQKMTFNRGKYQTQPYSKFSESSSVCLLLGA